MEIATFGIAFVAVAIALLRVATDPGPGTEALREADAADSTGAAAESTEDIVFYTIEPGCPPFCLDYVRWWVVKRTPAQSQSELKEGDLV